MPPNTPRVHTEYGLVKSGRVTSAGTGEYFPPLQFHAEIVEVEIGGVVIYIVPSGEFCRAKSYCDPCMVLQVNDKRTSSPLRR
ncbi:hypothetical protein TNCV_2143911 [Trichonephila clavipes]|nr:hypothetical protein TNCV_2143911 [Trichonephila clavipes]